MIELERDGGLWIVTLNRPDKANSLTGAMLSELAQIAEDARDARAFILTGAGKVFSAGADLDEAREGLAVSPLWERLSGAIAAIPGLTICAMNGTLAGGAMGMALACDLRLAIKGANIFYPVMKRGFLPQPSDPLRMSALIGPARTRMILMAGQKISASEAYAFGLVDRVVEPDDLMSTARALTEDILSASPETVAGIVGLCGKSTA